MYVHAWGKVLFHLENFKVVLCHAIQYNPHSHKKIKLQEIFNMGASFIFYFNYQVFNKARVKKKKIQKTNTVANNSN